MTKGYDIESAIHDMQDVLEALPLASPVYEQATRVIRFLAVTAARTPGWEPQADSFDRERTRLEPVDVSQEKVDEALRIIREIDDMARSWPLGEVRYD